MRIKEKESNFKNIYILDFPIFSRFLYFTFSSIHTYASRSDSVNVVVVFSLSVVRLESLFFWSKEKNWFGWKQHRERKGSECVLPRETWYFLIHRCFPTRSLVLLGFCLNLNTNVYRHPLPMMLVRLTDTAKVCGMMMKKRSWIIHFAQTFLQRIEEEDDEEEVN